MKYLLVIVLLAGGLSGQDNSKKLRLTFVEAPRGFTWGGFLRPQVALVLQKTQEGKLLVSAYDLAKDLVLIPGTGVPKAYAAEKYILQENVLREATPAELSNPQPLLEFHRDTSDDGNIATWSLYGTILHVETKEFKLNAVLDKQEVMLADNTNTFSQDGHSRLQLSTAKCYQVEIDAVCFVTIDGGGSRIAVIRIDGVL